ncbi:hypothetical protein [Dyella sp. C9]|uniref:hypothetical protein n=1 Tax=Dyella sp. C9 TaxID=2202154 RepID=UPI001300AC3A|nr:hypothetical protein [Dyella sp. C9]
MPPLDTVLSFLSFAGVATLLLLFRKGLPAYVTEKGKNLATREDIEEITRKIEGVRGDISRANAVEEQKRALKYEACLEALVVIDAHFSQLFAMTPQSIDTSKAREAHSKLILSCNNVAIVEKFGELYFGPRAGEPRQSPTDLLNEFRNLIRQELGFGSELPLDRERAWIGRSAADSQTQANASVPTQLSSGTA